MTEPGHSVLHPMVFVHDVVHDLGPARICAACGMWPCRCETHPVGPTAPMIEQCACGLYIQSATGLGLDVVAAVQRHNVEPVHEQWRKARAL